MLSLTLSFRVAYFFRCAQCSFSNSLQILFMITSFLIIFGIELNPRPTIRTTSASAGGASSLDVQAITDLLTKISNELAALQAEHVTTNTKIDAMHNTLTSRLDLLESNLQRHDTQSTSLFTSCDEFSVKVTALATSQPVQAAGSISSPAHKVNS